MLAQHRADFVEMLVERILFAGPLDPRRQHRAAAGHDSFDPLMPAQLPHALARNAAMERHVIDALARLPLDNVEKVFDLHLHDRALGAELVDRHRAEDHRASRQQLDADFVEVGAGRKIHHRIGAVAHRGVKLLDFFFDELMEVRRADVGVDLGAQAFADSDRPEVVMEVVRDDDLAGRDQRANFFWRESFVLGNFGHLPGNYIFAGGLNLRHRVHLRGRPAHGLDR